jgi:predicted MPP superfamily phosphohydrolase
MAQTVNILHISDLHYRQRTFSDQKIILDALQKDLEIISNGPLKPDVIMFTGDLVQSADDEDVYLYLYDDVISQISKITRCNENSIYVCPGNHDAQRSTVKKQRNLQTGLRSNLSDRDALNTQYMEGSITAFAKERFDKFLELREILDPSLPIFDDGFSTVYSVPNFPLDIISINTAWMTCAGLDTGLPDQRRLLFPEASLIRALDSCPPDRTRILTTHHPLNWLSEFNESDLLNVIDGNIALHLFGHMHEVRPAAIAELHGHRIRHQSGALYTGRTLYNGYALLRLELEARHTEIRFRTYFDRRREFDAGIDIVKNGIFYSSAEAETYWYGKGRAVDRRALQAWVVRAMQPAAELSWNEGIIDRPIRDIFVPPPMYTRRLTSESSESGVPETKEDPILMEHIVSARQNFIFHGRQEYGKTTLLNQIALALLKRTAEGETLSVPILIDFQDIKPGQDRITRLLSSRLAAPLEELNLRQVLEEGLATILIDDVVIADHSRQSLLRAFIATYSRNRFIYTTTQEMDVSAIAGNDVISVADSQVAFTHVFLKPFTRNKMRSLIEKWDFAGTLNREIILDRLSQEFVSINIPVTAVNGTILLTIYEAENSYKPINRAALIERFVEHLLEKRSLRDAERGTFDFTNKVHVLAHVAEHMARNDQYVLTKQRLTDVVEQYLSSVGLAQNSAKLVNSFVDSRVLALRLDDTISFRYRAFLEYFVACGMRFSSAFKSWVLEDERYLSYINEIQHFAGIDRDDAELLALVGTRFESLSTEVMAEMKWSPDLSLLEKFRLPAEDTKEDLWHEFERQMEAPPLTPEERDEVLEAELPADPELRQEVFRPKMEGVAHRWVTGLLLYSGLLKNMEIIPDFLKRQHLQKILTGWGILTAQSLWIVPTLAKHRQLKINGIKYNVILPRQYSEAKVARTIYVELPNSIAHLMKSILGTEKLELQLKQPSLEEAGEPTILTYYRYSLVADLRLGDWCSSLDTLSGKLANKIYLREALLRKIAGMYSLGFDLRDAEGRLRNLAGRMIGQMRGKDRAESRRIAVKGVEDLKRKELVRRLRLIATERSSD